LNDNQRLSSNDAEVTAQIIDGEAIIIRLSDGMYFSMNGAGSVAWGLIERRGSFGEIVASFLERYDAPAERIREDLSILAAELLRERLITESLEPGQSGSVAPLPVDARQPYEPPRLHQYQDMKDLLALDPPAPGLAGVAWKEPAGDD
jgi:hypothetical protein